MFDPYRDKEFNIGDEVTITGPHDWHKGLSGPVIKKTQWQSGIYSYEVRTGENFGYVYFADCLERAND